MSPDGTRIAYYVSGDGPPLVLSYGALVEHTFWRRLTPFLSGYSLYVVERRGRGESGDQDVYSSGVEVDDLLAVIEAVGEPVNLFGHSSGALLALMAAEKRPSLIRRLVLYEPPMINDNPHRAPYSFDLPERLRQILASGNAAEAIEVFFREGPQLPEADIQRQKEGQLWRAIEPVAHTTVYDATLGQDTWPKDVADPNFMVPTLLLYGDVSTPWVTEGVMALAKGLGNASVVPLPGQGHVAMFTAPEMLAGEITGFLQKDD